MNKLLLKRRPLFVLLIPFLLMSCDNNSDTAPASDEKNSLIESPEEDNGDIPPIEPARTINIPALSDQAIMIGDINDEQIPVEMVNTSINTVTQTYGSEPYGFFKHENHLYFAAHMEKSGSLSCIHTYDLSGFSLSYIDIKRLNLQTGQLDTVSRHLSANNDNTIDIFATTETLSHALSEGYRSVLDVFECQSLNGETTGAYSIHNPFGPTLQTPIGSNIVWLSDSDTLKYLLTTNTADERTSFAGNNIETVSNISLWEVSEKNSTLIENLSFIHRQLIEFKDDLIALSSDGISRIDLSNISVTLLLDTTSYTKVERVLEDSDDLYFLTHRQQLEETQRSIRDLWRYDQESQQLVLEFSFDPSVLTPPLLLWDFATATDTELFFGARRIIPADPAAGIPSAIAQGAVLRVDKKATETTMTELKGLDSALAFGTTLLGWQTVKDVDTAVRTAHFYTLDLTNPAAEKQHLTDISLGKFHHISCTRTRGLSYCEGDQLYVIDPSSLIPRAVNDESSTLDPFFPIIPYKNKLIFPADSIWGPELWLVESDLSLKRMTDLPGTTSGFPSHLTVIDDVLYFRIQDSIHGKEPWRVKLP